VCIGIESAPAANRIKRSLLSLLYIILCARVLEKVRSTSYIIYNDECSIHREMISAAALYTILQGYIYKEGFGFGHDGQYLPTIIGIGMICTCIIIIRVTVYLTNKYIYIYRYATAVLIVYYWYMVNGTAESSRFPPPRELRD